MSIGISAPVSATLCMRLERWISRLHYSRWTIGIRISALVLALLVPLNLVIIGVIWHLASSASEAQRTSLQYTARSLAAAVDAKLGEYVDLAQILSRSPALLDSDLAAFEAEARRVFVSIEDGWVVVANLEGRQLINTARLAGAPLPIRNPAGLAAQRRAFETRSTVIAGVQFGSVSKTWIVNIEVPVFKDGLPYRALSVSLKAQSFLRLLNNQHIPKDWIATIIDREGRIIARVPYLEQSVGQFAPEGWRKVMDHQEGAFEYLSLEGDPIVSAQVRSAASGWLAGVEIRKEAMQAAVWTTVRWAALAGAGLSILSFLLAGALSRRITRPIAAIRKNAARLLDGNLLPAGEAPPEIGDLWRALNQSVQDRLRGDQALRESNERLQLALDAAQLGTWRRWVTKGAGEMQCDARCRALLGLPPGITLSYDNIAYAILPEDRDQAKAAVERALDPDDPCDEYVCEYRVKHADGKVLWLSATGRAYFEPDLASHRGRRAAFTAGILRDVTEAYLARAARESEARLRHLSDSLPDSAVYRYAHEADGAPRFHYISAGIERLNGVRVEDVLRDAANLRGQIPAEYLPEFQEAKRRSAADMSDFKIEVPMRRPDGEVRWMRLQSRPHRSQDGAIIWEGVQTDITDRKRAEEAVRESEERFRGIFEHAATGIAIGDLEGRYQSGNPAFCSMLGYTKEEVRGLTIRDLVHPEDFEACVSQFRRLVSQEFSSFATLNRYVAKDGKPVWVYKHVSLLRDNKGTPVNALALVTNVTERKQHDDHIRLLMREVNHRSKNMLSLVQAIARQTLAADPHDFLDRFGKRVEALAANQDLLVKNAWKGAYLNELARSQLGHFEDLIGTRIALEGPTLIISAPAAQALGMALHELATNAGKYGALSGADGRVDIAWCIQRNEDGQEIFVMCWREHCAHSITAPAKQGFGSFVISSMIEMSLGAQVELDYPPIGLAWQLSCAAGEVVEGGSIPIIASERSTASGNDRANQRPRVLVVEDEALVAMEIAHALTEAGFDVAGPARDVPTALELLTRNGCDAAVLDINLGRETSEAIAIELTANKTPFVTLSGYSSEQHHPVFARAPALRKPLRLQYLVAEVQKCIGHKPGGPVDQTAASAQ